MNIFEKFFPNATLARKVATLQHKRLDDMASYYDAGGFEKQSFKSFISPAQSQASKEIMGETSIINDRAADLLRNDAVVGAIKETLSTGVVGAGIKVFPRPIAKYAGISDEAAEEFGEKAKFLFDAWASSAYSDATGQDNFYLIQNMVFINSILWGNGWTALQMHNNPNGISGLRLQGIDPFRIKTPMRESANKHVANGIQVNAKGIPTHVFIKQFDGVNGYEMDFDNFIKVRINGKYKRNILHLFTSDRFDQYLGVSILAPIMEDLKQINRYTEAELMGAVISSYFTAFITNPLGELGSGIGGDVPLATETDYKMAPGMITGLGPGQDVRVLDRESANASYEGFYNTLVTSVTASLGLPKDLVLNHFNKSFSASKAAFLQAGKTFKKHRALIAQKWSDHIYETFITEQVLKGNLSAPGYLTDSVKKAAYLNKLWVGEAMGLLDPKGESEAYANLAEQGFKTRTQVALEIDGSSYLENVKTLGAEQKARDKHNVTIGEISNQNITSKDGDVPEDKPKTKGADNE